MARRDNCEVLRIVYKKALLGAMEGNIATAAARVGEAVVGMLRDVREDRVPLEHYVTTKAA